VCFDQWRLDYPTKATVLVHGSSMRLSDLSEKTFDPPTTFNKTYTGEEAIKKQKELGLGPPDDPNAGE
jgi:hypothetical protein